MKGIKDQGLPDYVGSSPAMEAKGVLKLWKRSVSRL